MYLKNVLNAALARVYSALPGHLRRVGRSLSLSPRRIVQKLRRIFSDHSV